MDVVYAIKFNVVNKYVEVVTGARAPVLRMIQSDGTQPIYFPRKVGLFPQLHRAFDLLAKLSHAFTLCLIYCSTAPK